MDVTIAVVPRERFRPFVESLKSLFKTIDDSIPVVVVDGGAPSDIRNAIRDLKKERDFELIMPDEFVLPNAARNLALDAVKTKYVVYCDNDMEYAPYWLETLVETAQKDDAGAVAPTILIGPVTPARIHHAGGGFNRRQDAHGRQIVKSTHRLMNKPLAETEALQYQGAPADAQMRRILSTTVSYSIHRQCVTSAAMMSG